MTFDWVGFCRAYGIAFKTSGKNVQKGHVAIHCPFCGHADKSQHMGLELKTGYWGCWRSKAHRGKNPTRLIVALAHISWQEAKALVESETPLDTDSLSNILKRVSNLKPVVSSTIPLKRVKPLDCFRRVKSEGVRGKFWGYLVKRGFHPDDVNDVVDQYDIACCTAGGYRNDEGKWHDTSDRLILPFLREDGCWYGWTGRSIIGAEPRYDSFPNDRRVKQLVFNHEGISQGGRALVLVEGPLDTIKCDYYAQRFGVRFGGLLGTSITDEQVAIVLDVAARYDGVFTLLDPGAMAQALLLRSALARVHPRTLFVPAGIEDPGAMRPNEVEDFVNNRVLTLV